MNKGLGLYEYKMLSEDEQWDYLWEHGNYIAKRYENEFKVILYQVGEFYVEVFYNSPENSISNKRTFQSKKLLEPYLWQVGFSWN